MYPQTRDRWFVLTISCHSALDLERCAEIMFELGATAVEEIDNRLITHLDPPEDVEDALYHARDALEEAIAGHLQEGLPIPVPSSGEHMVEITIDD